MEKDLLNSCILNCPEFKTMLKNAIKEALNENKEEKIEDDNENLFPITFLPEMYVVQEDVSSTEHDEHIRTKAAENFTKVNSDAFRCLEQHITRLFFNPDINRESFITSLKDYCDNLYALAEEEDLNMAKAIKALGQTPKADGVGVLSVNPKRFG